MEWFWKKSGIWNTSRRGQDNTTLVMEEHLVSGEMMILQMNAQQIVIKALKLTLIWHTHNCFYGPFLGLPRWASARRNLLLESGLFGAKEDNKRRHTNNLDGRHSIRINLRYTSIIPTFLRRIPFRPQPSHLSWLRTDTKYAGLHTHWLVNLNMTVSSKS